MASGRLNLRSEYVATPSVNGIALNCSIVGIDRTPAVMDTGSAAAAVPSAATLTKERRDRAEGDIGIAIGLFGAAL
jgi:hypothetical protein